MGTEDLLRAEPEEGLEKVEDSIRVCQSFVSSYHAKKKDIPNMFKGDTPVVEWSFNDELIFSRLKSYTTRLCIIEV